MHQDWDMEQRIRQMSVRQKVGQLLICGFHGTEADSRLLKFVQEHQLGGVTYFARNVVSMEQVAQLSRDLQKAAVESGNFPLWISIDQEGGMVARITEGVALMPGNMALAAAGSSDLAYESSRISGKELRALGINMNLAPDLDVNNNALNPVIGVRSYGESPKLVAEYGARAAHGLQDAGVVATAKHFPGHGDTAVDSHLDLPTIVHDRERMERIELVPFRKAIAEGIDAMMSAHIYFPALEAQKLPVTLSHSVLTGLLREEMHFEGVIMTDCMEMKAIARHYGTVNAAVMAIEAGADAVLISQTPELQVQALDALEQAVLQGRIPESRIDASLRRLLLLKQKRGLFGAKQEFNAQNVQPGNDAHLETARRISEASITLVQNKQSVLPLKKQRTLVISVTAAAMTIADEAIEGITSLGDAFSGQGLDVVDRQVLVTEVESRIENLLQEARREDVLQIVIGTYNAQFNPAQIKLVQALLAIGKPVAVAALRNPYDLERFAEAPALVAAYESRPLALQSTAKAMLGIIPFKGHLPVSLGAAHPAGCGMQTAAAE